MEHTLEQVEFIPLGDTGWKRGSITLDTGDSIDNPASTKRPIYGPCTVTVDIAPDGGRNVIIS
jgi:hypothetical protein